MALRMRLEGEIRDHRLIIDLPENIADGKVVVTIDAPAEIEDELTLEEARARLLAGGSLQTQFGINEPVEDISDEELEILGRLPEDAPTSLDLINEDRGEY